MFYAYSWIFHLFESVLSSFRVKRMSNEKRYYKSHVCMYLCLILANAGIYQLVSRGSHSFRQINLGKSLQDMTDGEFNTIIWIS